MGGAAPAVGWPGGCRENLVPESVLLSPPRTRARSTRSGCRRRGRCGRASWRTPGLAGGSRAQPSPDPASEASSPSRRKGDAPGSRLGEETPCSGRGDSGDPGPAEAQPPSYQRFPSYRELRSLELLRRILSSVRRTSLRLGSDVRIPTFGAFDRQSGLDGRLGISDPPGGGRAERAGATCRAIFDVRV